MAKFQYFETLEALSASVVRAVTLACSRCGRDEKSKPRINDLRLEADKLLCELEDALFSDFLPPLERDNIAACAHCLSRVIDRAADLEVSLRRLPPLLRESEEGKICIRLAEQLHADVGLLRKIRNPLEMPSHRAFRALLSEGRTAHGKEMARLGSTAFSRSAAQSVILCGKLRAELSRSFDELVEIMLNNI